MDQLEKTAGWRMWKTGDGDRRGFTSQYLDQPVCQRGTLLQRPEGKSERQVDKIKEKNESTKQGSTDTGGNRVIHLK